MKVLLINDYGVPAGGAERIALDIRDGLRARGHEARLFASTASPIALRSEADDSCFGSNAWPHRILQVANPFAIGPLRRVLAAFRPDVIHVRIFLTQLSPLILPLIAETPALLHVGNHLTVCPLNTKTLPDGSRCAVRAGLPCYREGCVSPFGLARTVLQFGLWRRHRHVFRTIVANSEALAAVLRQCDIPVDLVIANGTRVVAARPPLADPPTVAFAGRIVEQKGLDTLLNAMAIVGRVLPAARLIVAGDGPDRTRIDTLVRSLMLGERVTMCGHVPRPALDTLLASAWVQAVPSRYAEGSPNVVPEAMMRGTAVVASHIGGAPEMVRNGATGFLVPPGDPEALAAALLNIFGDRSRAERLGAAGREVALAELTTDRMIDRFEKVYASL